MSKIMIVLLVVALVAMTVAKPQGVDVVDADRQVDVVDGDRQVNVVDGDQQVNFVDPTIEPRAPSKK